MTKKDLYVTEKPKTRCAVVHVWSKHERDLSIDWQALLDEKLEEAVNLAQALSLDVVFSDTIALGQFNPATLLGQGKVSQLHDICEESEIDLLYVNHNLTPIQQRNLEKDVNVKVIDRTGLILEIFGDRAQTKEGQLQVELAALSYQRSRLVRSWTHLERQRGGFGFTGGPGETQIEIDRRLIDERIARIKKDLSKVVQTRDLNRKKRQSVPYPIVALVGYTNAGKSTLFNTLTDSDVLAKDMLFATLDPTMRKLDLGQGSEVIVSDTVGFISDLPTELIASFRATLEEVIEADLILHVIDVSNPFHQQQMRDVYGILNDLGAIDKDDDSQNQKIIEVFNKIDKLSDDDLSELNRNIKFSDIRQVAISAYKNINLNALIEMVKEGLKDFYQEKEYSLSLAKDGKAIAWLYQNMYITHKREDFEAMKVDIGTVASREKHDYFKKVVK